MFMLPILWKEFWSSKDLKIHIKNNHFTKISDEFDIHLSKQTHNPILNGLNSQDLFDMMVSCVSL